MLSEIASASSAPDQGADERYLKVFEMVRDKDKKLGALFDNPRRSRARGQLSMIASAGLLTEEELSRRKHASQSMCLLANTSNQSLEPTSVNVNAR